MDAASSIPSNTTRSSAVPSNTSINSNQTIQSRPTNAGRDPAVPSNIPSVAVSSDEASTSILGPTGASSSITKGSSFEIYCSPCGTVDDFKEAKGYCSDCKEYYCQPCYLGHSRNQATKDHILMDQSTMPTIDITSPPDSMAAINLMKGSDADDSQCQDEFHFVRDLNIKHPLEKNNCYTTGMTAISDNELVIIDQKNNSVKMLNVDQNIMNGILFFDTEPFSITTIPNREVAVTFPHIKLIRIIHVSSTGELSVKQSIKLSGSCVAVKCVNNKLYVSYHDPVKFQILSLSGGVRKTIQPDAQVLQQRTEPRYIAVHPDESRMYVSDWVNGVVLCMDMHGTMLAVYKDVGLERPHDILFTPLNSIYLCNRDQHIIYKMADDLSEASVVLGSQDGLVFPVAMCFCPGRKYLYISSACEKFRDAIKQFKYS